MSFKGSSIDDYAKNGGPVEVWFLCGFYHESLSTWIKTIVNKFAISNYTALILSVHVLRSYLKLISEYELHKLHSLPNKKSMAQRIMVKTTSRSDRSWSAIFCVLIVCYQKDCLDLRIFNVQFSIFSISQVFYCIIFYCPQKLWKQLHAAFSWSTDTLSKTAGWRINLSVLPEEQQIAQ